MPSEVLHNARILVDVSSAVSSTQKLGEQANETVSHLRKMGDAGEDSSLRIGSAIKTIELSAIIAQIQGVTAALKEITAPALQFEQSMADLSAITGVTGEELEELGRTARKTGEESGLGAAESARAYTILASQIQVPIDQLKILQAETIRLAQAGGLTLEQSASALAGTLNQFNLEATSASRVINVLAAGSKYGAAEVYDLADSFKVSGAAAHAAGLSVEETAAAIEILSKNNTKGAEAGTAMRNMLIAMQTRLGIDLSQTGFVGGLQIVKQHLAGLGSEVERTTFLAKTFGRENIVAAQFLLDNAAAVQEMTAKVTDTNTATEQAEIRTATWAHRMEVLKARMDEWRISLVEATGGMLPWIASLGEQLVPLAQLTPLLNAFKSSFAGLGRLLTASPLGKYALIFAAVAGALVVAYKHSEEFRAAVDELWKSVKEISATLLTALKPAFQSIQKAMRDLMPAISTIIETLGRTLADVIRALMPLFDTLATVIAELIPPLADLAAEIAPITAQLLLSLAPALQLVGELFLALEPILRGLAWVIEKVIVPAIKMQIEVISELVGWVVDLFDATTTEADTTAIDDTTEAYNEQTAAIDENREAREKLSEAIGNAGRRAAELALQNSQNDTTSISAPASRAAARASTSRTTQEKKIYNLTTIEGLTNNIQLLQEKLNRASEEEAISLQRKINQHEQLLDQLRERIALGARELKLIEAGVTLDAEGKVTSRRDLWGRTKKEQQRDDERNKNLVKSIAAEAPETLAKETEKVLERQRRAWEDYVDSVQSSVAQVGRLTRNLGGIVRNISRLMGDSMGEATAAWIDWGANLIGVISEALPKLLALFNANMMVSASEAGKSQAGIPVVGPVLALASIAGIVAALTSIPSVSAFAEGGVVYGPTLGLVGEYAGANNNPEVIAPLNKLRDLIRPTGGGESSGEVQFRIRGRDLVGLFDNERKIKKYS